MKKLFITLAVLVMAFGNAGFAQRKSDLKFKANEKSIVFKHYGLRNDDIKPFQAVCQTTDVDETYRYTYTYDEYDYYMIESLLEMDYGYGWRPYAKTVYEYDFSGNVLEMVESAWEGEMWEENNKASYTYTADGMEVVYQYCVAGNWINEEKFVYNYNGNVTTVLIWEWNGTTWTSSELHTYTYSDTSIDVLMQYMEGGAWQNDEKQIFTLDFAGHTTEALYMDWENNTWVNDKRETYDFEGSIYYTQHKEDWVNGAWQETLLFTFLYDDGDAIHGECFEKEAGQWVHADKHIGMPYNFSATIDDYYGCIVDVTYIDVTGVEETTQASFSVYPLPAENEIQIQAESFQKAEIFSLTGQKLMESQQSKMNVSALASGVYLLKVYDQAGKAETQRIVVK